MVVDVVALEDKAKVLNDGIVRCAPLNSLQDLIEAARAPICPDVRGLSRIIRI